MREVSLGVLVLAVGCPVCYALPNMQPKGSGLSQLHLLHQGIRTGRLTCAVGRAWPQSSFLHGWAFLRCRSRLSMLERKDCFPGCLSTLHGHLQMSCQRVTDAALCGQQQGSWCSALPVLTWRRWLVRFLPAFCCGPGAQMLLFQIQQLILHSFIQLGFIRLDCLFLIIALLQFLLSVYYQRRFRYWKRSHAMGSCAWCNTSLLPHENISCAASNARWYSGFNSHLLKNCFK